MLKKYKKMGLAAAACTLLGVNASEAAVTLTFDQVGPDVTATWSGSYALPANRFFQNTVLNPYCLVLPNSLYGLNSYYSFMVGHGSQFPTTLNSSSLGIYGGDTFGASYGTLYFPTDRFGDFSPFGVMTFRNLTLEALGASGFNNTLAFRAFTSIDGNQEIRLHTVGVPEPSATLLLGLGCLGVGARRRRAAISLRG